MIARSGLFRITCAATCLAAIFAAPAVAAELKSYDFEQAEFLEESAAGLVPRRRDRGAEGPRAARGAGDADLADRTASQPQEDQVAAGLQDRSLRQRHSRGAADGLGRQGDLVRRLVRRRQCLCDHGQGRQAEVKTILKGLQMPTGVAFKDGSLYVVAINKLLRYDNAEANLDKLPAAGRRL